MPVRLPILPQQRTKKKNLNKKSICRLHKIARRQPAQYVAYTRYKSKMINGIYFRHQNTKHAWPFFHAPHTWLLVFEIVKCVRFGNGGLLCPKNTFFHSLAFYERRQFLVFC